MKRYRNLILDRDGVLNHLVATGDSSKGRAPRELHEIKIPVESNIVKEELEKFNCVVITNQPDVESGAMLREVAFSIHSRIMNIYNIKNSIMCVHKIEPCECRKPKTGMVQIASGLFGMKEFETILIGDRWTDILCGQNWGCDTVLLSSNLADSMKATENGIQPPSNLQPTYFATDWPQVFSILNWGAA